MLTPPFKWRALAAASACVVIAACTFITEACGCTPPLTGPSYAVLGTVTRADGTPAASAGLIARAYDGPCLATDSGRVDVTGSFATADTLGRFRLVMRTLSDVADACIRVRASAPTPVTEATPVVTREYEHQKIRMVNGRTIDSLVVTLTLPR